MGTTRFGSLRRWGSPSLSCGRTLVRKDLHFGREPCDEAANKELKLRANQELVVTSEHRVKKLEDEAKKSRAELESLKNQRKELE
ncbi:hypothetical protein BHE74_00030244 [Ensete ventricosum]|nr:hypothetical protein BHE74_00030244 [Ensete ventricosum]